MNLYYNNEKCCFSIKEEPGNKKVFETHHREGWNNSPEIIEEGRFKLIINTNYYLKSPHREYLMANLYLDGVKLLPVSKAAHITKSSIGLGLQGLAFNQYGPGENKGKTPCTYYSKKMDWYELLNSICAISENAEEWQKREFQSLLVLLKQKRYIGGRPIILGRLIDLFTPYEKMLNSCLYPMIRTEAFEAMKVLIEKIETDGIGSDNRKSMLEYGDLIWKCVKNNANGMN